jgi:hypothetical protein
MIRSDRVDYAKTGNPKKVKAFAHAAADVLERGTASIHLVVRSMMVKI